MAIRGSQLWKCIPSRSEYATALLQVRKVAGLLAGKIFSSLPEHTDHSVKHMDSLWQVTDTVLTANEIGRFSAGEAFLLGASFYLHDLGMAASLTEEGKAAIQTTDEYRAALARFKTLSGTDDVIAHELATREATREQHANKALELATQELPGLSRFLIEDSDFRDRWGHTLGLIAQSHHWSIGEVERSLGASNLAPGPDGEKVDLGYVACVLRVVDFAHINRERAPRLERMLRGEISAGSAVHWDAQAEITGPNRDGDLLVFGCTKPVQKVDGWWLFYDLCRDLDAEIRGVHDYLRGRTVSLDRFSLAGVKGTENPTVFSQYVRLPPNVVPVDIRVHPDSMERVVDLLGGKRIYGDDRLAPVRELIQNARDAIELKAALERADGVPVASGQITITLELKDGLSTLRVTDNGVGMTRGVVQKHLVGVGSDFWNSVEFFRTFGNAADAGFRPIGKFGIGFLSVFMLGDHVEVETEGRGGKRISLTLHGVGRRGELSEKPATGHVGTEVRISLKAGVDPLLANLPQIIRARAPMLAIPIVVNTITNGSVTSERIEPGWWKNAREEDLIGFVRRWRTIAHHRAGNPTAMERDEFWRYHETESDFGGKWSVTGWPASKPQIVNSSERLICLGGELCPGVVVCSQGVAIGVVRVSDITGIADLGPVDLTVSRDFIVGPEQFQRGVGPAVHGKLTARLVDDLRGAVTAKTDELQMFGMLPGRIGFLRGLASIFGDELLEGLRLTWIPVTEPPGNVVHRSKREFVSYIEGQRRLLLAVGLNPGAAYKVALSHISPQELGRMPVVAINRDEVYVDYRLRDPLEREVPGGVIDGTLSAVLSKASQDGSKLILTKFMLKCVAEAWSTSPETLSERIWHLGFKENFLWADLTKE